MDDNCCETWLKAQTDGTDNEGCYSLIHENKDATSLSLWGKWQMGYNLPPVKFCPWCGTAKD